MVDSVRNLMDGDRREEYRDFVNRYEIGTPPYGDIPDEEALNRYNEMTSELSEEDYQRSAREDFSRMAPEERVEFGRQLRDQADQRGLDLPGRSAEDRFEEPDLLAPPTRPARTAIIQTSWRASSKAGAPRAMAACWATR